VIITSRPEFSPPWAGRPHTLLNLRLLERRAEMVTHVTAGKSLRIARMACLFIHQRKGTDLIRFL